VTPESRTSHTPAATPFAEGIYAITSTGRHSHLAYHITAPALGEVQQDLGLREKGSFVVAVRNPTVPGPPNVSVRKSADYPPEIMQRFRGLRWIPLVPEMLDYEDAQFLIIGEAFGTIEKAAEAPAEDEGKSEELPVEEIEKLEDEVSSSTGF
jgi:hypothetical protein